MGDWITDDIFRTTALVLLIAAVVGVLARVLRQPLIIGFIGVGVLVGPVGLGLIEQGEALVLLAEIGVALLLFIVGLRLDLEMIRRMGPVALATGLGQVCFTSIVGFLIALSLGMSLIASAYVSVALTFSSTIIIVKLLTDKSEIDSLHGRIAVGFLIVQDICVVLALVVLSAVGAGATETNEAGVAIALVGVRGVVLLLIVAALMRWVIPPAATMLAKSQEMLVLASVAWAVVLAAACDAIGFSKEAGAFLAGVSLASIPYRDAIATRLISLRDFLLLFFFVVLGAQLDMRSLADDLPAAGVFSLFVLVGNPLIVMIIMGAMGYRKRTGFLAGLTVAQISEFSLVLAAMGRGLGHIDDRTVGLITLVGLITISASTYMILYSHRLYGLLSPWLGVFERSVPAREFEDDMSPAVRPDAIVLGLGRFGGALAEALRERGMTVVGVDFDPFAVRSWRAHGLYTEYGDIEDPELPSRLPLHEDLWVVSTIPHVDASRIVIDALRASERRCRIALTAHHRSDAQLLEKLSPDLILLPFQDGAVQAAGRLTVADAPDPAPSD